MINCIAVSTGAFLQCSSCQSSVSLEDCQNKSIVKNCSGSANDYGCFQQDISWYEKGSDKTHGFLKGCLPKKDCEDFNKGKIPACITQKAKGYETDCKAICCHKDECNKENLLPQDNKGSAFAISVMMLLSGLLLTLVNIN